MDLIPQRIRRRRVRMSVISNTKYEALNARTSSANILPRKIYFPFAVLLLSTSGLLLTTTNYLAIRVVFDIFLQIPCIPHLRTVMNTTISKARRTDSSTF